VPSSADTWNSRYTDPSFHPAPQPNPFLLESLPFLPHGRALDLACGAGQNAIHLAERGWQVTAIDGSSAALDRAAALAASRGIHFRRAAPGSTGFSLRSSLSPARPHPARPEPSRRDSPGAGDGASAPASDSSASSQLLLIEADLESLSLPAASFDVILCLRYLQRSLFPAMERALRPGGILVYETFTTGQLSFESGPRNPDHLLKPGELRTAFFHLTTLFYREWKSREALASLLARKPSRHRA
jgi:tellurite methyltransferase